ncbi:MAG: helix-turn-helix domain-containing protein [Propionibacteriaceae bacterium]|jgi:transcriptional regulator with XRE-family HTH domain|nr:helix-turn-helix domain-containing protein [Propionibacteriaceae bacterium]
MPIVRLFQPLLFRDALGESLRAARIAQGRTLRDVSRAAQISLGYLSEIERGVKEASSELLAAITEALDVPLWQILSEVAERLALAAGDEPVAQTWPVLRRAA